MNLIHTQHELGPSLSVMLDSKCTRSKVAGFLMSMRERESAFRPYPDDFAHFKCYFFVHLGSIARKARVCFRTSFHEMCSNETPSFVLDTVRPRCGDPFSVFAG